MWGYRYPRKFIKEFLLLYREKQCLWNKKLASYKNKKLRAEAFEELLKKMQKINPGVTMAHMKMRIERWRSTYRRHLLVLLKTSKANYDGPLYTPTLWYFPILTFLNEDQYPNLSALVQSLGLAKAEDVDTQQSYNYERADSSSGESEAEGDVRSESRPRRIMRQVLQMYSEMPCLWYVEHPGYRSNRVRSAAWKVLLKKFNQLYKNATVRHLRKKVEYCRTAYRRELKRVLIAREQGLVYNPKIWYYQELSCLQEIVLPELSHLLYKEELDHQTEILSNQNAEFENQWMNLQDQDAYSSGNDESQPTNEQSFNGTEPPKEEISAAKISHAEEFVQFIKTKNFTKVSKSSNRAIPDSRNRLVAESRDRFDIAAENIACKLRHLQVDQRITAEKLIMDVLYFAELKYLDHHAAVVISENKLN